MAMSILNNNYNDNDYYNDDDDNDNNDNSGGGISTGRQNKGVVGWDKWIVRNLINQLLGCIFLYDRNLFCGPRKPFLPGFLRIP